MILKELLHVQQLAKNLVSVKKLYDDNKASIEFFNNCFSIKDLETKRTLLKGGTEVGLYKFPIISYKSFTSPLAHLVECNKTFVSGAVWHDRLGYPHQF